MVVLRLQQLQHLHLNPQATQQVQATPEPTKETVKANTPAPTQAKQTESKTTAPASSGSVSQSNAVKKAKSYLNFTGFSHDGLVAQLEYEQFSNADAVYGADNSGANWNEQAGKKAKSYKFTQEQAEYGANAVGL
ncbi:MAG: hypothetical protein US51_C0005G0002 [Microgenomates group bacterium GW2011_GWA2_37_6]|nr:MAG: hypothetical protein US51_C0005G0002 [Microgenomates group bacterium GW2011_GWA2_37_6]